MAAAKKTKFDTFTWEGLSKQGAKTNGELTGASIALVKAELRRQGINPLKVKKKPKPLFGSGKKKSKIESKDICIFSRQMSIMMSSGVPLIQSFDIIGKGHDKPAMQDMLMAIKGDVEGGNTLSDALAKFPLQFNDLYCNLVNAGEQAGILETLLDKIATYQEKTENIKSKIKKAMFYPIAILAVSFIVTTILLLFVIPQFQEMFENFGGELPAMTKAVVFMSEWLQQYWYILFGVLGAAIFAFVKAKQKSKKFRDLLDKWILKLPIVGPLMTKAAIARFARTLATMFAAGMPLVEAMVTVAGAAGNAVYSAGIMKMREEVSTGTTLNQSMQTTKLFPNMVVQMVAIGEEAGSVDTMLSKVADFYEAEVDDAVDGLSSLLEPVIMAFLGVVIGGLVIAMYLPIFKMGQVV